MVIIHTADDIIRAMDENPEWLEAARARVLTSGSFEPPSGSDEIQAAGNRRAAAQNAALAEQAEMIAAIKQKSDALAGLGCDQVVKKLGKQFSGLLRGYPLNMQLVRVLRGYHWTNDMDRFNVAIADANYAGIISDDQHDRLIHADFIASMRRRESPEILYIAIEVSRKVSRNDVDKAVRSQDALQVVFKDSEILAAVYGWEISDEDLRYAESNGATVFIGDPEH